jgi:hypothetical protein
VVDRSSNSVSFRQMLLIPERRWSERRGDRPVRAARVAEPSERLGRLGLAPPGIEQVRAQRGQRRVERLGPLLEQLDDRGVEADRDRARDLEHDPRPRRRPAPTLTGPVAMPRPVHPHVRPQLEAVVEADHEVLAVGLDRVDRRARRRSIWGPGRVAGRPSPRGRRDTAGDRAVRNSVSPSGIGAVSPVSDRRGGSRGTRR